VLLQNRNSTFCFILFPNVSAQNAYYLLSVKGLGYPVIHARFLVALNIVSKGICRHGDYGDIRIGALHGPYCLGRRNAVITGIIISMRIASKLFGPDFSKISTAS
jgi:hypothetical protein